MNASLPAREDPGSLPHPLPKLGVVLVAAGRGERLGAAEPKAFVRLHGRTLIEFGIGVATSLPHGGHLVVVVPDSHAVRALEIVEQVLPEGSEWLVSVVPGGRERHESVRFGLEALHDTVEVVLVHDAARPFATAALFERVIAEVRRTGDAVVPALPVADTLKRVDAEGVVHETVDRAPLVRVQTPQGFPRELLAAAHADAALLSGAEPGRSAPTDDAEVVQRAGGRVRTVPGEVRAHKLTTPADLALLEAIMEANVAGIAEGV
ncbi:2-C-methyl-D-erythritol 4-phosphate cytidylyltransferase [Leucobacter massiliensis]|uniref:2-C-methyl-D-erythritol 4-phosphate cytidylyltransferase n=1 Tax=Leucobacter massiliensis TaxID=1686285 RepID=A0A2S9QLU2_9MICO|nr:2-C-methyl-D-erythritol 4-phosphate cytidylyltransferase [Leucobacter massiliensis]PRI10553.1 2-C-methyl-D-erythritol 4-phosphate cytidylyltransferase [Leucobacter massiliensis]